MMMENVEEIQSWGPLMEIWIDGHLATVPDPSRKGETFDAFIGMLTTGVSADHPALEEACEFLQISADSTDAQRLIEGLGYVIEHRELVAADYGAPTMFIYQLPLASLGLNWIIPSAIGGILGALLPEKK